MRPLLIIRAQPGAGETAARAARLGLESRTIPLFAAQPIAWRPADPAGFDAIMLTSAHAARLAGPTLTDYRDLPCYAVGEATAAAVRNAGLTDVRVGTADGDALLHQMERDKVKRVLHLCARNRRAYSPPGIALTQCIVYAVEGVDKLPAAAVKALQAEPVVLLHSPRSAIHFAALCETAQVDRSSIRIAAISQAAALGAGDGWARIVIADKPRDEALLELAAKLCKTGPS